jgi:hypothetical protein
MDRENCGKSRLELVREIKRLYTHTFCFNSDFIVMYIRWGRFQIRQTSFSYRSTRIVIYKQSKLSCEIKQKKFAYYFSL